MGKYTNIQTDNLKGALLDQYEGSIGKIWSLKVANQHDTDNAITKIVGLASPGAVNEWLGGRKTRSPQGLDYSIASRTFELGMNIPRNDYRRDKLGMFENKAREIGQKFAFHWNTLVIELLTGSGNFNDGTTFFSASHSMQDSGTQKNLLTNTEVPSLNVTTPAAPTTAEMAPVILDTIGHMLTFKDEAGDPINGDARNFVFVTSNPKVWASAKNAVYQANLASNETNPVQGLIAEGFKIDVELDPSVGAVDSAVFYLFRVDSPVKPFVLLEEQPVEFEELLDGSDYATTTDNYFFGARAVRSAGYQRWQHAAKATLS